MTSTADRNGVAAPSTGQFGRIRVPHNIEAEQGVLGCILTDDQVMDTIEFLKPGHFYRPVYGQIYRLCMQIRKSKEVVNLVTLGAAIVATKVLNQMEANQTMTACCEVCQHTYHTESYARQVVDAYNRRQMLRAAEVITSLAVDETQAFTSCQEKAESAVFSLRRRRQDRPYLGLKETFQDFYEMAASIQEQRAEALARGEKWQPATGIKTGFVGFDALTNGLQRGTLTVIGARTSLGKTSFSLCAAVNAASKNNVPVLINTLEMTDTALMRRLYGTMSHVPWKRVQSGDLSDEEWARMAQASDIAYNLDVCVQEGDYTIEQQRATLRKFIAQKGDCGLYVVDYLQRMRSSSRAENRTVQVGQFANDLQDLAKEFNVAVIAPAQVGRAGEGSEPGLDMLRESGDIENAADIVAFLHRERWTKSHAPPANQVTDVIVAKCREGQTTRFQIGFEARFSSYVDIELLLTSPDEPTGF